METVTSASGAALIKPAGKNGATTPTAPTLDRWVRAQALNLARHTKALRDFTRAEFGQGPEAPTDGHVLAVNQLLRQLRPSLTRRCRAMLQITAQARRRPTREALGAMLRNKRQAQSWVQRIEGIWDFYLELFGQRQAAPFGTWLLCADRIALDCYQAAYLGLGKQRPVAAPPPFSYMKTGFGPATYRRGIKLRRLGREMNPFPLIQLPYHRLINPWTLGAVLHEVSHNLQHDLGLNRAVPRAIARRLLREGMSARVARTWVRWNRETFADLSALLLGGPGVVASLMDVVGLSPEVTYAYSPHGVHPIPYLRVPLSVELLRRMGFRTEAEKHARAWARLYPEPPPGALPAELLRSAPRAIALVVDALCYQPMKELGQKCLAQVLPFAPKEQGMIEECAHRLGQGTDPGVVPARFLIGAARFALDNRLASPELIKENFYKELARR